MKFGKQVLKEKFRGLNGLLKKMNPEQKTYYASRLMVAFFFTNAAIDACHVAVQGNKVLAAHHQTLGSELLNDWVLVGTTAGIVQPIHNRDGSLVSFTETPLRDTLLVSAINHVAQTFEKH